MFQAEAFAKINRCLRVVGRRPDGYHDLDTVFQTIDLSDRIEVSPGNGTIEIETDNPSVPVDERNLVCRAGALLAGKFGITPSASVRLQKRIPPGSGLGGGSSDAAAALRLFCALWGTEMSDEMLGELASRLGSDVPFFLRGGSARGTGRGDVLTDLPDEEPVTLLLVLPPFEISTAKVYARHRELAAPPPRSLPPRENAYFSGNDLTPSILDVEPRLSRYLECVQKAFPDCQVSGSGSAIAARIPDANHPGLAEIRRALPDARLETVRTISRREYRRRTSINVS